MVLIDTSVWASHFRSNDPRLQSLLNDRRALAHPYVIGEIAMGSLRNRRTTLSTLDELRTVHVADHSEVRALIESRKLFSRGIGYIDTHLLASALLSPGIRLWTFDKRLAAVAGELGVGYTPPVN